MGREQVGTSLSQETLEELRELYPTADSTSMILRLAIADGIAARRSFNDWLEGRAE